MGTVSSLNPSQDTEDFCGFLYGVERGLAYLPTLNPTTGEFTQYFFKWPEQSQEISAHVLAHAKTHSVYISPALFSAPDSHKEYVRGSSVVWADFDGNAPTDDRLREANVPLPSFRIQSSISGRQHLYWKLDKFSTDVEYVEGINRAIAYSLEADPGGWDINQVLRPPGSFNHRRGAATFIASANAARFDTKQFTSLPVPKVNFDRTSFNALRIPKVKNVIHSVPWMANEIALLYKASPLNSTTNRNAPRYKILCKLAYLCAQEKKMDNAAIFAILKWVDARPKFRKFADRSDADMCYIRLIDYVRQKYPYESDEKKELDPRFMVYGFKSHISQVENMEWIVPGILGANSSVVVAGPSESGKTRLTMDWTINLALGLPFLAWDVPDRKPRKIMYVSAEMNPQENNEYFPNMGYSDEVQDLLEQNYQVLYVEGGLRLHNANDFEHFLRTVEHTNADGIFLDSASMVFSDNMSNEEEVKAAVSNLKQLREKLNKFVITIHHPRKNPPGVKSNNNVDDMHGAQVLINQATTAINIKRIRESEDSKLRVDVSFLKTRLGSGSSAAGFRAEMDEQFHFKRSVLGALPVAAQSRTQNGGSKKREMF